jgi:hypothetical protein
MSFGFAIVQPQLPSSRVSFKCVHMINPPTSYKIPLHVYMKGQWRTSVDICSHLFVLMKFSILGGAHREGIDRLRSNKIGAFLWGQTCNRRIIAKCVKIIKMNLYPLSLCYGRTHMCMRTTLVTYFCHHFCTNKRGRMYVVVSWLCWHLRVVWL